ncbi:putative RNA helicase [Helianthus annuus]|nr:putative RNA helicase [Helianthus annuus]KAJ0506658.1 putative RNA helicase [Helianthus annuus]
MLSIVHVVFVDCITVIIVLYLSVIISCIIVFCRLLDMESDLKTWVSDKLMSLLGFSQPTLVQYLISLSKKASSPCDVYNCLKDMQVSSLNDTQAFAEEIFRKVEHKSSGSNAVAMLVRKQRNFELLADDGDIAETVKSDKKAKSFRKKRKTVEDEDDDDESEEERVRDKKERAELERRLRKKEVPWTTKPNERLLSKRKEGMTFSRREYFKRRELKKLEEIRDDILDEEYLFGDVKVSEIEQRDYRYKKQIYEVATKLSTDDDNINMYRMPDAYDDEGGVNQDKRFAVAMERCRDLKDGDKMNPSAEQEAWEDHQISMF